MKLPFLKERSWPRMGKPQEEKLINGSPDALLEDHLIGELMNAVDRHDVNGFRSAMEALVLHMFQEEEPDARD